MGDEANPGATGAGIRFRIYQGPGPLSQSVHTASCSAGRLCKVLQGLQVWQVLKAWGGRVWAVVEGCGSRTFQLSDVCVGFFQFLFSAKV